MTQVDFYVNAEDRHDTARRICMKAYATRARVFVLTSDSATSTRLSRLFWSVPSTGFLPHCGASDALAAHTAIIVDSRADGLPHQDILLNLQADVPACFERFRRVIEIVGNDPLERDAARQRFRHYRDHGHTMSTTDLAEAASTRATAAKP